MTNDTQVQRRAEIREAMLERAAARRRMRVIARTTATVVCALAVGMTAWIALQPSPVAPPTVAPPVAIAERDTDPAPPHDIVLTATSSVVDRAISDDELLDLLREAGEEAGLAIIDGKARLVRWRSDTPEEPGDSGTSGPRPDARILAAS